MMKVSRGDLIITSKPFAYVLNSSLNTFRCIYCLMRNPDLKRCTGCGFAHFCDKKCQKAAWIDHKLECTSLKKVHPRVPPPHVLLLARIIRKLKRGGHEISENIGKTSRKFENLISHSEEIKNDSCRHDGFVAAHFVLTQFLNEDELLPTFDVLDIFGKVLINTVSIAEKCTSIGAGLYLGPSVFNHSCQPNITFVFSGPTLIATSLADFEDFDVSKAFVNYIDVVAESESRRKELQEQYYFTCECQKCCDASSDYIMTAVRCQNEDCKQQIFPTDIFCSACGAEVDEERRKRADECSRELRDKTNSCVSLIDTEPRKVLEILDEVVSRGRQLLHPLNIHLVKALHAVFEAHDVLNNYEKALEYGVEVSSSLKAYYSQSDYLMWHLERLGRNEMELGLTRDAIKSFSQALKGLRFFYANESCVDLRQIAERLMECKQQL